MAVVAAVAVEDEAGQARFFKMLFRQLRTAEGVFAAPVTEPDHAVGLEPACLFNAARNAMAHWPVERAEHEPTRHGVVRICRIGVDKAFKAHVAADDLHLRIKIGELAQRFHPEWVRVHPEQADAARRRRLFSNAQTFLAVALCFLATQEIVEHEAGVHFSRQTVEDLFVSAQ